MPAEPGREAAACVVADCTYSAADGSAYCTLHGVKWGREQDCQHRWDALRSIPPSWRCAYCGEVTEVRQTTAEDAVQWATKCHDCGDGVRLFDSEEEAREQYERDSAYEDQQPADERHTIVLLNRRMGWNTVTTTAWEGRRDRI